jgi:hypothetical protein
VRKLLVGTGTVFALALAGAAVAFATNSQNSNVRLAGGALDTVTFPDGTVATSAYVGGWSGTNVVLIQIKQLDGKVCYGLATQNGTGGSSISCPP